MQNEKSQAQFDKMTKTPVEQLILRLAVPTIISMLVTNVYNLADTYFVSTLGTSASGAVGIVFALMAIIQAFGFTYGQGAGSIMSRALGSGDLEKARRTSTMGFAEALVTGILMLVFGLIFIRPLMVLMGSTETILPYAMSYARFILLAAPAMTVSCVLNNQLRYEGKASFAMIGLVSGGLLNILGDFLLIRVVGMGIEGAGISTMVTQYISVLILAMPFLRKQVQTRISWKYFSFDGKLALNIVAVGFPSIIRQGLASVSTMVMNWCAGPYGDAAIAAMSIVSRTTNFLFCVAIGIGQGFQPVSAFNYGAKLYSRVKKAFRFMIVAGMVVMSISATVGFVFAEQIVTAFRDDPEVIAIGTRALRVTVPALLILPFSAAANMLCQSIGKSLRASFLASTRSGLFYIPTMVILSHTLGLTGIEITQVIADVLAIAVSVPIAIRVFKEMPEDGEDVPVKRARSTAR